MATIAQDLQKIRTASYGEEVREAIIDGLEHCYHIHDVNDETAYIRNVINAEKANIQSAINDFEAHKAEVVAAMTAMGQLGTDTTLSTSGVAADAAATGEQISLLKNAVSNVFGDVKREDLTDIEGFTAIDNTAYMWFQYPAYRISKIDTIEYVAHAGTTNFYKLTWNYTVANNVSATATLINSVTNTSAEEGKIKSFSVDLSLTEYDFIAVNGAFYAKNDSSDHMAGTMMIQVTTPSIAGRVTVTESSQHLAFNALYSPALNIAREEDLKDVCDYLKSRPSDVLLYNKILDANNEDFTGTATMGSFGRVIDRIIVLKKMYGVADKTVHFLCKFQANSIGIFGTCLSPDGSDIWTFVQVFVSARQVQIHGLNASSKVFYSNIINSSDPFILELSKFYNTQVVRLTNLNTCAVETFTYVNDGCGTTSPLGDTVRSQVGYYFLGVSGDSFECKKVIVQTAPCDVLAYGDSITELEAFYPKTIMDKAWTMLCREKMHGRFLASGYSGSTIDHIIGTDERSRIRNELPFIKPRYCMVTIGTNQGNTVEKLTALVQYIKSQNAIPILNHIPCYKRDSDTSGFITINQMIDQVRESENIKGANFDLCTSLNNDGRTIDSSCFWNDGAYLQHPNAKGSMRMFNQLLIDVPEIFG